MRIDARGCVWLTIVLSGCTGTTRVDSDTGTAGSALTQATTVVLGGGLEGDSLSLNGSGQVAGYLRIDGAEHAVRWANGVPTDLHPGNGLRSIGVVVNEAGDVGGMVDYNGGGWTATVWPELGGPPLSIAPTGTWTSDVAALNSSSQALVRATLSAPSKRRTHFWSPTTGLIDVGDLGGGEAVVNCGPDCLNEAGQIIGQSSTASGVFHAFVWGSGVMTQLGALGPDVDSTMGIAGAINDAGLIVGASKTAAGIDKAVKWVNGVPDELDPSNAEESIAMAVNNGGDIVGYRTIGGQKYATLWRNDIAIDLGAGANSVAFLVNDLGIVAGIRGGIVAPTAFVWTNVTEGAVELTPRPGSAHGFPFSLSGTTIAGTSCTSFFDGIGCYATLWEIAFDPGTPEEQIADLQDDVADLEATGALGAGQAASLSNKLDGAVSQCEHGHEQAAHNQIRSFIHHVEALVTSGKLTPEEGQALIDAAETILDTLVC